MSAQLAFAFGAGLLATVNPCGFAMLPSFLSLYLGSRERAGGGAAARAGQGFLVGVVLSGAFGGVFIVSGLVVSAGLRSFLDAVPWLATAIGVALVLVGLALLAGRHVGLTAASRIGAPRDATADLRRVALFGLTYALASLSCTLAVFLVVVGQALAAANPLQLLAVFAAYAAGSASLLIALSMSAALAKRALERTVRRLLPLVSRLSGALLIVSGAYLVLYWLPSLGGGRTASTSWAARTSESVSSALAGFFGAHTAVFAGLLGALVVLGIALLAASGRSAPGGVVDCCEDDGSRPAPGRTLARAPR